MHFCDFNYPPNMTFFVICFLSVLYNLLTHYMYEICRGLVGVETEVEDHVLLTSSVHVHIQHRHTGESHTVCSPLTSQWAVVSCQSALFGDDG